MQFTQQSKSQLAKLMATENISVQHGKVETASFDLKNRVLTVPIWKDMSGELYDLLLGHEVGHALETPEQGWHNAVMGTGKFDRHFKHFLNVVEDCRIEKKVKRRYPGLKKSFIAGYNHLFEKNFFGIQGKDINQLPFIDRLNIYTKSSATTKIDFSDEELDMVRDVESCETWDDVLRVTKAIFDYSKEEQKEMQEQMQSSAMPGFSEDDEDGEESDSDFGDESYPDDDYDYDGEGDQADEPGDDGEEKSYKKESGQFVLEKYSKPPEDFVPVCKTDEEFRKNETKLLSEENFDYVYVNIPEPNYKHILTPYTRVHDRMESSWQFNNYPSIKNNREEIYLDFRKRNERYISLLAKEFEMRKSASKFSKQKISDTGDIDVSKIFKYQIDDNIFRKMTKVPKGKSHGLVMIFDRSGSMKENLSGTIEQMLVLALFCKKVNIPFVVYGFGNEHNNFRHDSGIFSEEIKSFECNPENIFMYPVFLREYLNSRMSTSEFTRCVKNLTLLANSYITSYSGGKKINIPDSETLSNTPLVEAFVALRNLTVDFKNKNNLDIVKTIVLHDGDADLLSSYMTASGQFKSLNRRNVNLYLNDKKKKMQFKVNSYENDYGLRESIMKWYKETTDSDIIGFFITAKNIGSMKYSVLDKYFHEDGQTIQEKMILEGNKSDYDARQKALELAKKMKDEKFLESHNRGYSKFFMIPGGNNIQIEDDEMDIDGKLSQSKLRNAFLKMNKKRQINRVLVNKFIKEIAV